MEGEINKHIHGSEGQQHEKEWRKRSSSPAIRSSDRRFLRAATLPLPLFCPLAHIETLWPQCWSLSWFQSQKNDFHGFKRTWLSVFLNPHQFNSGWVIWTWEMDWFGGLRFWPKTNVTSIYHQIWRQFSPSWQKTAFFVSSDFLKVSIVPRQLAVLLWQTDMITLFIMASLILQFGRKTRRSDSLRGLEGDFCSVLVAVSGQPDEQPWCSNVRRSIQLDRYGRCATLFQDLHLGNW